MVDSEIVPVHSVASASASSTKSASRSRNSCSSSKMKVKIEESVTRDVCEQHEDLDAWLWGGSFGSRSAILVFRSNVLAAKDNDFQTSIATSPSLTDINSTPNCKQPRSSKKSGKLTEKSPSQSRNQNTVPKKAKNTILKWNEKNATPENIDIRRKRDIRDVLSDINKIANKKKSNTLNTTDDDQKEFKMPSNNNEEKTVSFMPNIPQKKKEQELKRFESLDTKFSTLPSMKKDLSPTKSTLSLDSVASDLSEIDDNNIKILEKTKMPAALLNMSYKTSMTETKLLSKLLHAHGFVDVDPNSKEFNLMWNGLHPKPDVLRSLTAHQRVNHFPRSYELTRKDKLFKNIEKMQYFRGAKNFDFIPVTFLMPIEYKELCTTHYRTKGPWIVKPAASSRGRGIYIVNAPHQIPKGESVVVAKYIDKPLLVDGHKCDLRLYVCVTSFDPLLIYMYEEGLVRFATVKYDKTNTSLWNSCMHLCNYSINKYHSDYIKCDDPSAENVGHKWTLSALLRHLKDEGHDTCALMSSIEDVVVKSILSCTHSIATASKMFVPHFNNCFELYGFDILLDETFKPWLLEINLSPSLGCDSALDARLKSSLLADTLTLVGIPAVDPTGKSEFSSSTHTTSRSNSLKMKIGACRRVHSAENMTYSSKKGFSNSSNAPLLTNEETRMIKLIRAQYKRRRGYVRIFPSQDSWQKYSQYLDPLTGLPVCSSTSNSSNSLSSLTSRNYNYLVHCHVIPNFNQSTIHGSSNNQPPARLKRYERVLPVCLRVSLDTSATNSPTVSPRSYSMPKDAPLDSQTAKVLVKQQIQKGMQLPLGESRRVFGMFLNCVLKRISNSTSEQSAQHAELILKFLKRASTSTKMQYNLKSPPAKMSDKDKAAVIAKQLNDFLHLYHRETDVQPNSNISADCVSNAYFSQFICGASEADLEDILLTILRREGNVAPFLGDRQSPICIDLPPPLSVAQVSTRSLLSRSHQLLRYLSYVTPVHCRRYKAPNPESNKFNQSSAAAEDDNNERIE